MAVALCPEFWHGEGEGGAESREPEEPLGACPAKVATTFLEAAMAYHTSSMMVTLPMVSLPASFSSSV